MIAAIAFYVLATVSVFAALRVVLASNPVHSVLWLILAFLSTSGLFVLLGAEFVAMLLVIVYVGAVAVLFLFVVMMLDVDFAELKAGFIKNAPIGAIVGGVVLAELVALYAFNGLTFAPGKVAAAAMPSDINNTEALGRVLYTKYVYFFQGAGMVLLVAMIGAIVLTLRHRESVKRQSVPAQVARDASGMSIIKVGSGEAQVPAKASKVKEAAE